MLKTLTIKNIALIEDITIGFCGGMNCLTGETGAGKSIIIDSIGALLGSRVKKDIVRTGCKAGSVRGEFFGLSAETAEAVNSVLPEYIDPAAADNASLVLEREISAGGRHVCRVNGYSVASAALRRIGETLVDIHGQSESRLLVDDQVQLRLLDAFCGEALKETLDKYHAALAEYKELKRSLKALSGSPAERARTIDLLEYQIREIDGAQLSQDEEEYLTERSRFLAHAEKIRGLLDNSLSEAGGDAADTAGAGDGGVQALLGSIRTNTARAAELSDQFKAVSEAAESLYFEFEDFIAQLAEAAGKAEYDPQEAELVSRRLDYLFRLKSKYGESYAEIMKFRDRAAERLAFLTDSEEHAAEISTRISELSELLFKLASKLSERRTEAGSALSARIMAELRDLEMGSTEFRTDVDFFYEPEAGGDAEFGPDGLDRVEFLISPNPGQPLKPLSRIASGGELSRIMLAIKTVQNRSDNVSTLIFDEIDTGISGLAARRIAEKLKKVSELRQVICVTHHAQLAAAADNHVYISKSVKAGSTSTAAEPLSGRRRTEEIARLLDGGGLSEIAVSHAEELLRDAGK